MRAILILAILVERAFARCACGAPHQIECEMCIFSENAIYQARFIIISYYSYSLGMDDRCGWFGYIIKI